ncbi:RPEL repeat protein [Paragonimus westermani]|uniref:RPEL repeat protein n=1 Tax=Paragonimus westermani TaxID=34504 RepID=A0A8T0DJL3_9TREM|nr:RPEL repeat protein [Paragonimus westermani]
MSTDSSYKKSGSPQASTEVSSLQVNKLKNRETLERRLRCRRPIKELVNQGILLNPCISNADKVRQLQRAKTSDLLKQKIEKRPDRQYLVSRRIIRDDKPGTSPYILEQCHNLEKYQLKSRLNCKLTARPGTLELIEKGVLQVDPGVDSLIRYGSIPYPRVENVSSVDELPPSSDIIPTPPPLILKTPSSADSSSSSGCSKLVVAARNRSNNCNRTASGLPTNSRSMKDETIVYKLGSLVFHNYCPKSVSMNVSGLTSFQQKQKAREAQQAEMLRLQDTARAHRMVEQELSKRVAQKSPNSVSQTDSAAFVPIESCSEAGDSLDWISAFSSPVSESSDPHNVPVSTESNFHLCDSQLLCPVSQVPMSSSPTSTLWAPIDSSVYYASSTVSSDQAHSATAFRNTGSLEQLTANQLRAECRERKLARSGSKATLIRQLEPYRHEINCKYFVDPDPKLVHCTVNNTQDSSKSNWLLNIQPKCSPPPSLPNAPPTWTVPVNSCMPSYSADNCQNAVTSINAQTSTSSGTVFLCPAPVTGNTMSTTVNTSVLLVSPNLSYPLNFGGVPLRHSLSVPYMSEISSTQQAATGALPVGSSIPTSCISRSVVSFPISSTTLPVNVFNQTSVTHIDRPQMSSLSNPVVQPSAILIAPSVLPFTHAASAAGSSTAPSVATGWLHSTQAENSTVNSNQSTSIAPNLIPNTVYTLNPPVCTVSVQPLIVHSKLTTSSSHLNDIPSIRCGANPLQSNSSSTHSTGQPPSLNQIEEIWLRIRQLRRQIAKERAMESWHIVKSETDGIQVPQPNLLHDLVQEHDRLAVLCRLLVIDRIDALDELIDSGVDDSGSFDSPSSTGCPPTSRLQVERNLMDSYLRKLGGSALVSQISSPMHNGLRRSSSPSLNSTHLVDSCCVACTPGASLSSSTNYQLPVGCTSADAHYVMATSTPRASLAHETTNLTGGCTIPATLGSRMHLALSWSDGLQKLDGHSADRLIYSSQAVTDVSMGCPILNSETLEPAPSPTTVDAFFELWNSVFKDSAKGSGSDELNSSNEQTNGTADSVPSVTQVLSSAITRPTVQTFLSSCSNTNHNQRLSSLQSPIGCVSDNSHLFACDSGVYRSSPTLQVQKDPLDEHMKSPLTVSRPTMPFDWPSLVSSPCTNTGLPNDRQTKYTDSCRTFQTPAPVIDLAEALFASLGTEVMDTSEPSFCLPSVAMNWSVDA